MVTRPKDVITGDGSVCSKEESQSLMVKWLGHAGSTLIVKVPLAAGRWPMGGFDKIASNIVRCLICRHGERSLTKSLICPSLYLAVSISREAAPLYSFYHQISLRIGFL